MVQQRLYVCIICFIADSSKSKKQTQKPKQKIAIQFSTACLLFLNVYNICVCILIFFHIHNFAPLHSEGHSRTSPNLKASPRVAARCWGWGLPMTLSREKGQAINGFNFDDFMSPFYVIHIFIYTYIHLYIHTYIHICIYKCITWMWNMIFYEGRFKYNIIYYI